MHANPVFRKEPEARALAFARDRGFGVLTIADGETPLAAHCPFVVSEDGATLGMHLMRSNPIARAVGAAPRVALLAVSGPDAYVSPDWYGLGADQVPTWNYVAVHLRGVLRPLDPGALRAHLDAVSAAFETRLAPKPPWRVEKMDPDAYERMARSILPFEMALETVDSTWKLNQNKPEPAQAGAATHIAQARIGSRDAAEIADLMQARLDDADASSV